MASLTTFASFVNALEALSIAGVERRYQHGPPTSAPGTGEVPAQFVRSVSGSENPLAFGSEGGWPSLSAVFVIAVGPVAQETGERNFDKGIELMDALGTALRLTTCTTRSKLRWTVDLRVEPLAGIDFWQVIANIEGDG